MRIRLARKIEKNPKRYSWGKYSNALVRLGWQRFAWHYAAILEKAQ